MTNCTCGECVSEQGLDSGPDEVAKDIIVLYHANCNDGFGAATAAFMALGNTAEYIAVNYDEPVPECCTNKTAIYIVDFCYKTETLLNLIEDNCLVVIIDHHKTAQAELENAMKEAKRLKLQHKLQYIFSLDNSGAVLAWRYFHETSVPNLLLYIQERDLWRFKLKGTKEVCAAIASEGNVIRSLESWTNLIANWGTCKEYLISTGIILLEDFNTRCAKLAANAYKCELFYPHPEIGECFASGLAINAGGEYASEVGNILAKKSGTFGAVWYYQGNGKYKVSLRSIGDFDVSAIASCLGGGGHKNAANFYVNRKRGQKLRNILVDISGGIDGDSYES